MNNFFSENRLIHYVQGGRSSNTSRRATPKPTRRTIVKKAETRNKERAALITHKQNRRAPDSYTANFVQTYSRSRGKQFFNYNSSTPLQRELYDSAIAAAKGVPLTDRAKRLDLYQRRIDTEARILSDELKNIESAPGSQHRVAEARARSESRVAAIYAQASKNREINAQGYRDRLQRRKETALADRSPQETKTRVGGLSNTSAGRVTPTSSSDGLSRTQRLGIKPFGNRRSEEGKAANAQTGTPQSTPQSPPQQTTSQYRSTGAPDGTSQQTDIPTDVYNTQTGRQGEAAAALDADNVDAPDSLANIRNEELEAIEPKLAALGVIRNAYKIYQRGAENLIDQRGQQINEYRNDSHDRAAQGADLKIQQSKSNRSLELELIAESRDRARRDEFLAEEKVQRDYDREEDRIIGENKDRLSKLNTSLGARYGGFGSGKGLEKIDGARKEGERVLRELTEDRIHARREHVNKLDDIESNWKLERKTAFNEYDKSATEAFTSLLTAAQGIDDKALDEDGDKLDSAGELLKDAFDQLDSLWSSTGDALTLANQRALDRRDAVRKEEYDHQQDALGNLFSASDRYTPNSPIFNKLETDAGFVPGTLKTTSTYEERRMTIAEQSLRNNNERLRIDMDRAARDGNAVDETKSEALGYLVQKDGSVFRDSFGNPVFLSDTTGTFSGNSEHDRMLFGNDSVSMHSAASFKNYALGVGDVVPGSPYHRGGEYDIDGNAGDPIPAWTSGVVVEVGTLGDGVKEGYGNYVDISDGKNIVRYAHLQDVYVQQGQQIQGKASGNNSVIGTMGNSGNTLDINGNPPPEGDTETGSHLHLEARDADGNSVDLMDIGVQTGVAQSGKITWVDDQRRKFRGDSNTSWAEIDQSIYNEAVNAFKDSDGKTNWKAVDMVRDYINDNKKGQYFVSEEGSVEGTASRNVRKKSAERLAVDNEIVSTVQSMVAGGAEPFDVFYAIQGETDKYGDKMTIDEVDAAEYLLRAGYKVDNKFDFGTGARDVSRRLTPTEKELLNEERRQNGLPEIE